MKRNYEKKEFLIFSILVFVLFECLLISSCFTKTYRTYDLIDGIVITDNYIKSYVDNNTLKKIKSASKFYIDDKTYNYKIIEIEKNVIKKNKVSYHEVLIRIKYPKKYKDNDAIRISVFSNKEKIYKIFKKCWESD